MSQNTERGARSERGSALWGTGSRGGDRSSVLWGKGGRGILVSCIAAFALAAPMAAMADSGKGPSTPPGPDKSSRQGRDRVQLHRPEPPERDRQGRRHHPVLEGRIRRRVEGKGSRRLPEGHAAARSDRRRRGGRAGLPAEEAGGRARPHRHAERGREAVGRRNDAAVAVRVGQRSDVARRHDHVRRQDACDRHRRLGHPEPRRLRRSRHRERQSLDDRGQHLAQRRARSRHLRGRHRGGRFSGSDGCRSCSSARLGEGDERPGPGQDVRRHHGGSVDPGQQVEVQHRRCQLLAALELQHELLS